MFKFSTFKTTAQHRPGNGPIIKQRTIQSISELKPFFQIVTASNFVNNPNQNSLLSSMKLYEASVHEDFLEGWIE
jgi:hypothetical protein